jgi:hypothetical protein
MSKLNVRKAFQWFYRKRSRHRILSLIVIHVPGFYAEQHRK